jgi:hypothetical protein
LKVTREKVDEIMSAYCNLSEEEIKRNPEKSLLDVNYGLKCLRNLNNKTVDWAESKGSNAIYPSRREDFDAKTTLTDEEVESILDDPPLLNYIAKQILAAEDKLEEISDNIKSRQISAIANDGNSFEKRELTEESGDELTENYFKFNGEVWEIKFRRVKNFYTDLKGLHCIALLIEQAYSDGEKGKRMSVKELDSAVNPSLKPEAQFVDDKKSLDKNDSKNMDCVDFKEGIEKIDEMRIEDTETDMEEPSEYENEGQNQLGKQGVRIMDYEVGLEMADEKTIRDIRKKLGEKRSALYAAKNQGHLEQAEKLEEEIEKSVQYLSQVVRNDGKPKKDAGGYKKAKDRISKNIKKAIEKLEKDLVKYLNGRLHTKNDYWFEKDDTINWDIIKK